MSIQLSPCNCGASIVALEPALAELSWPAIDGGDQILLSAYTQTMEKLRIYDNIFKSDTGIELRALINTIPFQQHESHGG